MINGIADNHPHQPSNTQGFIKSAINAVYDWVVRKQGKQSHDENNLSTFAAFPPEILEHILLMFGLMIPKNSLQSGWFAINFKP